MLKRIIIFAFVFLVVIGILLISFEQEITSNSTVNSSSSTTALEGFLKQNNATAEIVGAYKFALENPQGVLSKVKCYCGCLTNGSGHKNNRDCFFNEDGSFDLMGLNCGLCIKTALTSKQMLAEGKSVQEISDYVDGKWGKLD